MYAKVIDDACFVCPIDLFHLECGMEWLCGATFSAKSKWHPMTSCWRLFMYPCSFCVDSKLTFVNQVYEYVKYPFMDCESNG